jgi:hypothetical protein
MTLRRLPPTLLSLFVLIAAWLPMLPLAALEWPTGILVVLQGVLALLLSRWLELPSWWQAINTLFFPLAWLALQADIHPLWYLAAFALLATTSLGSLKTRVPLYLSSRRAAEAVAERAPDQARVIDLGCGLGGWLDNLKVLRPDLQVAGVEVAPLNWLVSRLRLGKRADIRLGSLWEVDLSGYDVVYAYLSPAPMAQLWDKVQKEMRPGALLVSNTFSVPGIEPDETIELHDLSQARLLIWRR